MHRSSIGADSVRQVILILHYDTRHGLRGSLQFIETRTGRHPWLDPAIAAEGDPPVAVGVADRGAAEPARACLRVNGAAAGRSSVFWGKDAAASRVRSFEPCQNAQLCLIETDCRGDLAMLVKEFPSFLKVEYR